ncbi:hypothetical protein [Paracoccus sp. (in: a-proteobacteria)]|uniref:hypothetical protein n=1 Tax=Paracoccus sp. TaxID=267 RepID=UPI0026DF70B2|nr:hypothetical protein [Paracoccus sp. (in: a-proteobacteria)]MDO5646839.1 hypothetical protein [Paracoccus sp. (in: a-proteobacteria)]
MPQHNREGGARMTVSLEQALTRTLVELLYQLEKADASQINSDFAVALMESVAASLQQIEGRELARFTAIIREIAAADVSQSQRPYVSGFF